MIELASCLIGNLLIVEGVDVTEGSSWLDFDVVETSPEIISKVFSSNA